jgi:8-oxo-dGTP pyrophosphatase MutT (NUDIX family)
MPERTPAVAYPAATLVLLREAAPVCEVLLVRRNAQLAFHGGAWVFPGGRIDAADYAPGSSDVVEAARRAAIREAAEEAGVQVAREDLVLISRWITPEPLPKRFDTWFFAAAARGGEPIRIDGGEIHAHEWMSAGRALEAHRAGEIELPPPTFVTLLEISRLGCVTDVLGTFRSRPPEEFLPRLRTSGDSAFTLYKGDAAYEGGDVDAPGPRHRLRMAGNDWRYERDL